MSAPRTNADVRGLADALEQLMRAQVEQHRRLLRTIEQKRDAIRHAQIERLTGLCQDETAIMSRVREIEKQRVAVVARLTGVLRPGAERPMTAMQIAAGLGDPAGTPLIGLAAELRAAVEETQRTSSIVRSAIEVLSRHMSGIAQVVHSALSRAQVYGRAGRIMSGAQVVFNVDLKS